MKNRENNKGFSLVELIVVIAIMAVLVGVLAPTLLRYVEKARVSKDITAISEVENAINLAAAEEAMFEKIRDAGTDGLSVVLPAADLATATDASKLQKEVANTISGVEFTSSGLEEATVTLTATEENGIVTVTVTAPSDKVTGEAVQPFTDAFGSDALTSSN